MANDSQERLWQEQMHRQYCAWIESINASNRAIAYGGPALVIDPNNRRERMEGLCAGETMWFDVKDGPASQRGRHRFVGPNWHGPFPEYSVVSVLSRPRPPTAAECVRVLLDFKTDAEATGSAAGVRPGFLRRVRAALHFMPRG